MAKCFLRPVINPDLSGKTQHLSLFSFSPHTIVFMVVPTIDFMVVPTIVFMVVQGCHGGLKLEDYLICRHEYHMEGPAGCSSLIPTCFQTLQYTAAVYTFLTTSHSPGQLKVSCCCPGKLGGPVFCCLHDDSPWFCRHPEMCP